VSVCSQDSARFGTPDCPVRQASSGELVALRKLRRCMAIIHQTVRWCTGLSGEPTAVSATVGRQIRGRRVARSNGQQGAPNSVQCANCHKSATIDCARL
jgi:hypothetical protein